MSAAALVINTFDSSLPISEPISRHAVGAGRSRLAGSTTSAIYLPPTIETISVPDFRP
jgi:hypothetical protein